MRLNDARYPEESVTAPSAAEEVNRILAGLLNDLQGYEQGIRAGDAGSLHNYRVSLRRARVAVSQFRKLLPAEVCAYFTGELRWLGQESSPLRDIDVYLKTLDQHREWLPEDLHATLKIFREYLRENRKTEQEQFARTISGARYHQFICRWRKFSEEYPAEGEISPAPGFETVCRARIWHMYHHMLREGNLISRNSPASALHELRKDGKKLRYLLEFYSQYGHGRKTGKLKRRLRQLQTILGKYQDAVVQAEALFRFCQRPPLEHTVPNSLFLGLGMLGYLSAVKTQARKDFSESFKKFSSKDNRCRFRALDGSRSPIRTVDK